MKIAYLGPEDSYSHLAADTFLKTEDKGASYERDECIPFRNFSEVFHAVETGRADAAAVPIENSLEGGVLQNLDLLQASEELYAVRESLLKIDHRLIYREGTPYSEIGRVYSHRQALGQCLSFLSSRMPFASLKETESTAFGVARAAEDFSGRSAAIAGAHISFVPEGFVIGEECISDEKNNFTQFLLVKKGRKHLPRNSSRIFFSAVCPHRPGSLLALLEIIAAHGVNMSKIESRPVKDRPGDYRFFIEAETDVGSDAFDAFFREMKEKTLKCKLLGAYNRT